MKKLVCAIISALVIAGCQQSAANRENANKTQIVLPTDYTNGVYYFPVVSAEFGNSLAAFLHKNPCDLKAIAADDWSSHGVTIGYFVVCVS